VNVTLDTLAAVSIVPILTNVDREATHAIQMLTALIPSALIHAAAHLDMPETDSSVLTLTNVLNRLIFVEQMQSVQTKLDLTHAHVILVTKWLMVTVLM
jgi:hypothetical protein